MTPERWKKITELYQSALDVETRERRDFLARACGEDTTLLREVQSLLNADADAGDFISGQAYMKVGDLLEENDVTLTAGQDLGHYKIVRKIGVGGMGEVYLAADTKLNREVAIKTLPLFYALNHDYLKRFQTEVKASASMNHPNVATVFSVEEIDGLPFFTMEYVEGRPLSAIVKDGPLPIGAFLDTFIPLADALAHAHRKGVIHRDIKPGNILVQPDGTPKVLDFGLAYLDRAEHERSVTGSSLTLPGQVLGTPAYMSPEQAEGREIDQRSDIFSLGIVMYEAITGKRPFQGDNYASIISKLLGSEPVSVTEIKPETPFLLARLIHRCLEKTRRKRFQSMSEVRVILEEIKAAVEAGISMDPHSADRILRGRRKMRWPVLIVPGGFLVAIAIILGYFYFYGMGGEVPFRVEDFSFRRLSQSNDIVYAAISPNGKSVAYNTIDGDGDRSLWIRMVEDKTTLRLMEPIDAHYWGGLTFSNDGGHIYFITAKKAAKRGTLYRVSALGGSPRKLVDNVNDLGSVSPDDSRVLLVRYLDKMQLISANAVDGGGEKTILTAGPNIKFKDPQFSHDGKSIYFIKFREDKGEEYWSLVQIPAEGGEERVIISEREPALNELVVLKDGNGILMNAVDPISNLTQLYYVSSDGSSMVRITNDLNVYFGISASDDGRTIVAAQRIDAKDIWVGEGGRLSDYRRITSEPTFYLSLTWTPDGRILYDSVDNNRPHIWIMNADGSGRQQLTPDTSNDLKPAVSIDGSQVFFVSERSGESKIWKMGIDGTSPKMLIDVAGAVEDPVVAPDGKLLYFTWTRTDKRVIGKYLFSDGTFSEFDTFSEGRWALSPDGTKIAYSFYDSATEGYKVGIKTLQSSEPESVLDISPINVLMWTPDGKGLLFMDFTGRDRFQSTIWRIDIDGGSPVPYVSSASESTYKLAIAPDGKRNAVVTRRLLTDAVMLTRRN